VTAGGTAADIIAPACKDIFLGNDPQAYKHNGSVVSKTGAWSSILQRRQSAWHRRHQFDRRQLRVPPAPTAIWWLPYVPSAARTTRQTP